MSRLTPLLRRFAFGDCYEVAGRTSVADLYRSATRRCGVYVLEFANGEVYGGQAVDVSRRFAQHLKNHHDVVRLHFKRVPRSGLNEFERSVIHALEGANLPTRNITFASAVVGETDLDVVMPVRIQKNFQRSVSFNDKLGKRTDDAAIRRKLQSRYGKFEHRSHGPEVESTLREYVPLCVPAFLKTELAFWVLSIPPRPPHVYARLNVGWQEVLTAYEVDGSLWYSFHIAGSPFGLVGRSSAASRQRLGRTLGLYVDDHTYAPGGPDQVHLVASPEEVVQLLRDKCFLRAARLFNLRLMRKGATPYGKFHVFAFADRVLPCSPSQRRATLRRG